MPGPFGHDPRAHAAVNPNKPGGYAPWPGFSGCLKSLKQLLDRTISAAVSVPNEHPPFRSRSIVQVTRAVVNVPAAFSAPANAAGIALAAAQGVLTGVTLVPLVGGVTRPAQGPLNQVQLLTPTAAVPPFGAQPVWQDQAPAGYVAVWKSWGITVVSGGADAAVVTARVGGGPSQGTDGPDPFTTGADKYLHQPTMVILPENKLIQVSVQNIDTGSPVYVITGACGWVMPIREWKDNLESMMPGRGYGLDCEGF